MNTRGCFGEWPHGTDADVGGVRDPTGAIALYHNVELGWYLHYLIKHHLGEQGTWRWGGGRLGGGRREGGRWGGEGGGRREEGGLRQQAATPKLEWGVCWGWWCCCHHAHNLIWVGRWSPTSPSSPGQKAVQ